MEEEGDEGEGGKAYEVSHFKITNPNPAIFITSISHTLSLLKYNLLQWYHAVNKGSYPRALLGGLHIEYCIFHKIRITLFPTTKTLKYFSLFLKHTGTVLVDNMRLQ